AFFKFDAARFFFAFGAFFGSFFAFFAVAFFLRAGRRHFARDFHRFRDGLRFTAATGNEQGDQQAEDDGAHDRDDKAQIAFRFLLRGAATAWWLVAIVHESGGILVHTYYL